MFRTVPLSIIGSFSKAAYKPVWHIPLLSVQWINSWWWTEELSETCRVSCQNKFVKLVHLVGFIIKKFNKMHGHMNVKFNTSEISTYNSMQLAFLRRAVTDWIYRPLTYILWTTDLYAFLLPPAIVCQQGFRVQIYVLLIPWNFMKVRCPFVSGCPRWRAVSVWISVTCQFLGIPTAPWIVRE